jgi:hypothetical protein
MRRTSDYIKILYQDYIKTKFLGMFKTVSGTRKTEKYIIGGYEVMNLKYSNIYPTRCNVTQFIYIWKLLYMFRVVPPPIIRNPNNYIYSIWYLSHRYCYLPLSWKSWNRFE